MNVDPYDLVTRRIAEKTGYQPPNEKGGWRCPAHGDNNPSLSVTRGNDGRVLVHCHVGCTTDDVLSAIDLTTRDLYPTADTTGNGDNRPRIDRTYPYVDEHDHLLYEVVRTNPKGFRQRRPDGHGGWTWKLEDTRRVLYRLPKVLAAAQAHKRVWVCEGEKDVEAVERAGETATCNPGGAGNNKWKPEYSQALKGARVTIIRDMDKPGAEHAALIAEALDGIAQTVRIVEPAIGKDAADHLGAGLGLEDFVGDPEPRPPLEWVTAAEHAARVDGAPPVGWLIKSIWPADGHGVIAAEMKAGKTWGALDLAVSVASGTPWLGMWDCDTQGPVIVCLGEGGERKMLRRLRAICGSKNVRYEDQPIHLTFRVPHLTDKNHLAALTEKVTEVNPVLVIIDPLYLAARGAKASQLIEMGEHLESVQQITQTVGSALAIVHHWNKTGTGGGASRMTGVGGQEWGRVLLSAEVKAKHTDQTTKASKVTLEFDLMGDEVPEATFRVRRTVWADDPDDLNSVMHYHVEQLADEEDDGALDKHDLNPAAKRTLAVLMTADDWLSVREIGDRVVVDDTGKGGLKKRTIQDALVKLAACNLAVSYGRSGGGEAYSWRALDAVQPDGSLVREQYPNYMENDDDLEF